MPGAEAGLFGGAKKVGVMGIFNEGVPRDHVDWMRRTFGLGHFVETGTYHGDTAAWAAGLFGQVTTIEAQPALHRQARERHAGTANIDFRLGDTRTVLSDLVPTLTSPALFWLDAHWSALDTAGEGDECPVLEELAIINASPLPHVVLVDDARCFLAPPHVPHDPAQWPDIVTLYKAVQGGDRRYACTGFDVVFGIPAEYAPTFIEDWRRNRASKQKIKRRKTLGQRLRKLIG